MTYRRLTESVGQPGVGRLPEAVRRGRFVLCEEAARDGAQGKTLLLAAQRVELFRRTAAVLGRAADECLVSMIGFPAIGPEEVAVIRRTIEQLDVGYQQVVCRTIERDIAESIELVRDARAGRVLYVVPASAPLAAAMLHTTPERAVEHALDLLRGAVERAGGEVAVDVCLADIARADTTFVADAANRLTRAGAEVIMLADTTGRLHPVGHRRSFERITSLLDRSVVVHAHFHNDLGFAHTHNLQNLELGHRMFGVSWLGLGERNGLGHTEELLATLVTATDDQLADLGTTRQELGVDDWDGREIVSTARWLAAELEMPRRVTDPFVGTGVNAISTGTPFVSPADFQPYDAEALLGVEPRVELTHLASDRVIRAVAERLGRQIDREEARLLRSAVKQQAYATGRAQVDPGMLFSTLHEAG